MLTALLAAADRLHAAFDDPSTGVVVIAKRRNRVEHIDPALKAAGWSVAERTAFGVARRSRR